jgi:hypothetical protein
MNFLLYLYEYQNIKKTFGEIVYELRQGRKSVLEIGSLYTVQRFRASINPGGKPGWHKLK